MTSAPPGWLTELGGEQVCYLQTIGRSSGRPRTIEIWFATDGARIYMLAGGREGAHWVRNLMAEPRVRVRIGGVSPTSSWRASCSPRNTRAGETGVA